MVLTIILYYFAIGIIFTACSMITSRSDIKPAMKEVIDKFSLQLEAANLTNITVLNVLAIIGILMACTLGIIAWPKFLVNRIRNDVNRKREDK